MSSCAVTCALLTEAASGALLLHRCARRLAQRRARSAALSLGELRGLPPAFQPANPRTKDFTGFDSSRFSVQRGGTPRPAGKSPEIRSRRFDDSRFADGPRCPGAGRARLRSAPHHSYTFTYTSTYTYTYTYTHTYTYTTCTCTCIHIRIHTYKYYTYTHVYVYLYIYSVPWDGGAAPSSGPWSAASSPTSTARGCAQLSN